MSSDLKLKVKAGANSGKSVWPWLLRRWKDMQGVQRVVSSNSLRCHLGWSRRSKPWQTKVGLSSSVSSASEKTCHAHGALSFQTPLGLFLDATWPDAKCQSFVKLRYVCVAQQLRAWEDLPCMLRVVSSDIFKTLLDVIWPEAKGQRFHKVS